MEWAMSNMVNHPDVLRKARVQLGAHLSKLYYRHSIISETLRLHPAAPLPVPYRCSDDCVVGGYDLPRDTTLLVNLWAITKDTERVGVSLLDLGLGDLKNGERGAQLGRRACPGMGLGQPLVGLTLGSFVRCFAWERIGYHKVDMTEGAGITMLKAEALEVV